MEENDKKRKADKSPLEENEKSKLIRKAKKKASSIKLKLSSSSEEDDRNRTPSGSVLLKKVSDIRTFFSPCAQEQKEVLCQMNDRSSQDLNTKQVEL